MESLDWADDDDSAGDMGGNEYTDVYDDPEGDEGPEYFDSELDESVDEDLVAVQEPESPLSTVSAVGEVRDGRFQIVQQIGHNPRGAVYHAIDLTDSRNVAFKSLTPDLDPEALKWECALAIKLHHPNTVKIYTTGEDERGRYIAYRLMEESLASACEKQKLNTVEICDTAIALANALETTHRNNLFHGFIHPENVLFSKKRRTPKLTDFGFAHRPEYAPAEHEAFLAPELRSGRRADARTDVYGLCVTIYAALSGRDPRNPDFNKVPVEFRNLLRKGMGRNRAQRPADITEILRILHGIKEDLARKEMAAQEKKSSRKLGSSLSALVIALSAVFSVIVTAGVGLLLSDLASAFVLVAVFCFVLGSVIGGILLKHKLQCRRADQAYKRGLFEEAFDFYSAELRRYPDDAELHFRLGRIHEHNQNVLKAAIHFKQCLEAQPKRVLAHKCLANALRALGRDKDARHHYRQVLAIAPGHGEAHYNLGIMLAANQPERAIVHLEKALEANPQHAKAHTNLATLVLRQGAKNKAARHFGEALNIDPYDLKAHNNLAALMDEMGHHGKAEKLYRAALTIDGNSSKVHANLGVLMVKQNRPREAETHFKKSIELDAGSAFAHRSLADLYQLRGEESEAERHYRTALKIDPHYVSAHRHLADLLRDQGRTKAAAAHYLKAKELKS